MRNAHGRIAGRYTETRRVRLRRRSFSIAGALLILFVAIAMTLPIPSLGGSSIAVAAIQRAKSFVELMHQRSPGKRLVGHLVKTKHKKLAMHERALPKIRKAAPAMAAMPPFPPEIPPALVDLFAPAMPVEMASLEAVPVGPFAEQPLWPFPPSGPPGGYILPPTESPSPTFPPIGPPAAGVPEPASWTMMLLGFAIIARGLRRRKDREQIAP